MMFPAFMVSRSNWKGVTKKAVMTEVWVLFCVARGKKNDVPCIYGE